MELFIVSAVALHIVYSDTILSILSMSIHPKSMYKSAKNCTKGQNVSPRG